MPAGIAVVANCTGSATITRDGRSAAAAVDAAISSGAQVALAKGAAVTLVFSNLLSVQLSKEAEMRLTDFAQEPFAATIRVQDAEREPTRSRTVLELQRGVMIAIARKVRTDAGSTIRIEVPGGTVEPEAGERVGSVRLELRPRQGGGARLEMASGGGAWVLRRPSQPDLRIGEGTPVVVALGEK